MITHGRHAALDLGTARTRLLLSGNDTLLDEPSAVPADLSEPDTGTAGAVPDARWRWPVRHGMVADASACARLTGRILRASARQGTAPLERLLLGVPVAASGAERRAAVTAVRAVAGCPVAVVEEPLAAAVGSGVSVTDPHPRILLDMGAGIIEAAVISRGQVVDTGSVQIIREFHPGRVTGMPAHLLTHVAATLADLVNRVPASIRRGARDRGLIITGGGATRPGLAQHLCSALRVSVSVAPDPARATVRGLARLLASDRP
ncbi:rod shape-determining protein [Streptosporangium sp. NPDC087985]|uniref:rod shape-determining protein n=1 Tax=Streptosporangium sp. NPDC087985 TaxID=3366196 RepID=UPI0037F85F3D